MDLLNPTPLCYRESWRGFKRETGRPERFSATLNKVLEDGRVHIVRSHYAPYNKKKLCFLVNRKVHEKLSNEFGTNDYGRYIRFDRFSEIKRRRRLMRKHLVEEFVAVAKGHGLGVGQRKIEFLANGTLIRERYWELRVPGAGSFVLVFRQFNCRDVTLCDLRRELGVARALYALRIAGRKVDFTRADKIEPESRHPEVTPATKPVSLVIVAPEVNAEYLGSVGIRALYVNGPRYVPGFSDPRSNYFGQVRTRRGLRIGLEFALRRFVFFIFKRRFPRARNAYVIFRMRRCGIVFERSNVSLADFLPERLNQTNRGVSGGNTRTTSTEHIENPKPPPPEKSLNKRW